MKVLRLKSNYIEDFILNYGILSQH